MQLDKDMCQRFPVVLRKMLQNKAIELPDTTMVDYEKFIAYRAVNRKSCDNSKVTREDFRSYFELGKKPKKKPRGVRGDYTKNPEFYGTSCSLERENVELQMKFPNPNKKMASGYVHKEGGPQNTNVESEHVCWWFYEDADVSSFELI